MATRSLGSLTLDVVVNDGSVTEGMNRVERTADRAQRKMAADAKRSARESERAWQTANANIEKQFDGMSEAQYRNNMRMVPAQITDIVVSLQGGQAPLTVLLQQGGQLRDMFGSIGGAARALGQTLAAVIRPVSLVLGGVAALALGYVKGEAEANAFNRVLGVTGNQVGTTASGLSDMAYQMDRVGGVTRSAASAALVVFATEAGVGADRLQKYTQTALDWEKATGVAADEVAKNFKKIAEDPVKGLLEVNKQMGFLTSATFEQVKALQESGRETEAVRVAQDAYDRAVADTSPKILKNLGYVERAWNAISGASGTALDKITNVGRTAGIAQELTQTALRIAELQSKGVALTETPSSYAERDLLNLKNREIQLQKNLQAERAAQAEESKNRSTQEALIDLSEEASKYADKQTKKRQELAAAEQKYGELAKTNAVAAKQYAAVLAGIEEKYKAPKGPKTQDQKDADASKQYLISLEKRVLKTGELSEYEKLMEEARISNLKLSDEQMRKVESIGVRLDMAKDAEASRAGALVRSNTLYEEQERLIARIAEYQSQIAGYGKGDREVTVLRERNVLLSKQGEEIRKLQRDQANALIGAKDPDDATRIEALYADRIDVVRDAQQKELALFEDFQTQKKAMESDGWLGATAAINTYVENSQNAYAMANEAAKSAFSGLEDIFVSFTTTGKASFADFANSVIADMARITARRAIGSFLDYATGGGGFLSSLFGGGKATGGQVSQGMMYQVNENGPELLTVGGKSMLMMGGQSGYIHNGQTAMAPAGGGGLSISVPISISAGSGGADASAAKVFGEQLAVSVRTTVQKEITKASMPGGQLWAMRNGRAA